MAKIDCDCSGWATKANLKCGDGQTIMPGAFKDCDGMTVPVCWGHIHDDPMRVLGRALLEHKDDGTYAYIDFNNTEQGRNAKELVQHGDVCSLSICANNLVRKGSSIADGVIREVSLVLSGMNPGAYIDTVLDRGEGSEGKSLSTPAKNWNCIMPIRLMTEKPMMERPTRGNRKRSIRNTYRETDESGRGACRNSNRRGGWKR